MKKLDLIKSLIPIIGIIWVGKNILEINHCKKLPPLIIFSFYHLFISIGLDYFIIFMLNKLNIY